MKKCRECRGETTESKETYPYDGCGLKVILFDVVVRRCPACGAHEALIPGIAQLHRAIAEDVISKPEKLAGAEIRFLRKQLGWSGVDFAGYMGVGPSVVSNWENDKDPIGGASDRLLRMLVRHGVQIESYELDELKKLTDTKSPARELKLRQKNRSWALEAH